MSLPQLSDSESPRRMRWPSDAWLPYDEALNKVDDQSQERIRDFVAHCPWESIEQLIHSLRPDGDSFIVVRDKFAWGQSNFAIEVRFSDGSSWILRMPMKKLSWQTPEAADILREVAITRLIKERTLIPVPAVIDFRASAAGSPLGCAYTIQEGVVGVFPKEAGLDLVNDIPADVEGMDKMRRFLRQYAEILLELDAIRFPLIGALVPSSPEAGECNIGPDDLIKKGPFKTCQEYFGACANYLDGRALLQDESHREECLFMAMLWRRAATQAGKEMNDVEFAVAHCDLHPENILVDENCNIVAVLDWSEAHVLPRGLAALGWALFANLTVIGTTSWLNQQVIDCLDDAFAKAEASRYPHLDIGSPASLTRQRMSLPALLFALWSWMALCDFPDHFRDRLAVFAYGPQAKFDDLPRTGFEEYMREAETRSAEGTAASHQE